MFLQLKQHETDNTAESGFVLVLALVVLLMISLFGVWALQTATSELNVAGGSQQAETQLNISEGAANAEAGYVGFGTKGFYMIADPSNHNRRLVPTIDVPLNELSFDPGSDTPTIIAGILGTDATTWPWGNLLRNYNNIDSFGQPLDSNRFDYRYLVTYLYPDTPPMGYDATAFSGYKFRIQGGATQQVVVVELGGIKVGVKASL